MQDRFEPFETLLPSSIVEAKKIIRNTQYEHWKSLARTAFDFTSIEEIEKLISFETPCAGQG